MSTQDNEEDCYYAIYVNKSEDAKMVLGTFMNYVKGQYKAEIQKKKKNEDCKYKYMDENGEAKIPFEIYLTKYSRDSNKEVDRIPMTLDYDLKLLKKIQKRKRNYVPMKDRIPGKMYDGKKFIPKNKYIQQLLARQGERSQSELEQQQQQQLVNN